ncbi:MAG: phosphoribosylanthranilate isomerase [Candidatus Syntrophonatronum acetioxidans]|uniref:N-(5'-phosphoribosyl)anthranilate isomerase n=1 Tax=Candidatus Syntrophonatronum acetioxidans TaxID=1795816 RepID=A0A424YHN4_9FIRM|nr:MAG: phosphoribosylanthranilate isomerase [Candidatus Syntrophonatronum acetioxidans]
MVRVKICGIQSEEEAHMAVKCGAEGLGFIMAPSPRRLPPEKVREICLSLPPFISRVGVFVDEDSALVREIAEEGFLEVLQFHGREDPSDLTGFRQKVVKALAVKDEESLKELDYYRSVADAWLLDTYMPGLAGGTGKTFNWTLACRVKGDKPLILAGGLTQDNILEALEQVKPYAVDVSSGVEIEGKKDLHKIQNFIYKVRCWKDVP